ncbi:hypothetical protein EIP91_007522 [Steccherinum ochraceum]|uniref:Uncharacterized protein n=1 Tax=Steccherinum ochraceum TaxID=92696 RepID=A0A4R0R6U2_9APHY|nr:hypothetical protein EIP91_007522 [Steccherinum ochraceum]
MDSAPALLSTPSPRLSYDIFEEIVGHLAINPGRGFIGNVDKDWSTKIRTLKACSLVCHDLLHCSRRHLFRDLSLRSAEELEEFISLRKRLPWLADCISLLYVYGSAKHGAGKDQSWISTLPFRLFPLIHLSDVRFHGVDLTTISASSYKAFHLHGPQNWTFSEVIFTRYSQITQLLPARTERLSVLDKDGRASTRLSGRLSFHHIHGSLRVDWTSSPRTNYVSPMFNLSAHAIPRSKFLFRTAAVWEGYHSAPSAAAGDMLRLFREYCTRQHCGNQISLLLDLYQHDHRSQIHMAQQDAKRILVVEIRARSLSCVATFPIMQALHQARSDLFTSLRVKLCNESTSHYRPEANPPVLDMHTAVVHWAGIDAALARENYPNIQGFSFQCFSCTNHLFRALLPGFTSVVKSEDPSCKPCHGSDVSCAYHRTTDVRRPPILSLAVLERIIGYLSPAAGETRENLVVRTIRQPWISAAPLRLLPLLTCLVTITLSGVDLRLIGASAYEAFRSHGPVEWTLVHVKYTKYSQITQLLPMSTTHLRIDDSMPLAPQDDDSPGQLDLSHIRGPLNVDWIALLARREDLARHALNVSELPRTGFDFLIGGWATEGRVQPEDTATLGCVRNKFVESIASVHGDVHLHYFSGKHEVTQISMWRSGAAAADTYLQLRVETQSLNHVNTTHVAELLHHTTSPSFTYFILELDLTDEPSSEQPSSSDIKTLSKHWESVDATMALYPNLQKFELQCHLARDVLPVGYKCTKDLIGNLLPKVSLRLGQPKEYASYYVEGKWHRCAYHGFETYT